MPCPLCGTKLLFTDIASNKTACPKCDHILVVDRMLATRISTERLTYLYGLFMRYMRQFKKNQLIAHIIWEREKYSRDYFENYQGLDMSRFVSYSYLIKNLMVQSFDGYREANAQNTPEIISRFSDYLDLLTEHIYLKEGFAEMIAKQPFDPNPRNLTIQRKLSQFKIMYNEDYSRLIRTFANNEIYPEEEGRRKIAEYRKEWEMIMRSGDFSKKVTYTPEGLIKKSYPELNRLYCGLLKNVVYASTFDFSNYRGIITDPAQIMELANGFMLVRDYITVTSSTEFEHGVKRVFADTMLEAKEVLLFSETNLRTFPLFVLLDDHVFISHRTAFLIYLLLHPIIVKEYFDRETVRRSKELETQKTREAFEKASFMYVPDVKDNEKNPTIQIDGLAGKGGVLYVVEVKGWGLTTFYEHKNKHEYLERDLKGVVDGIEYTTKDGKLCEKQIPSLLEKIEHTKNKMHNHGFDPSVFRLVKGAIVIEDFPPIDEYKGVRMIGLQDISKL
jgi:hypothetical protein